MMRTRLIAGPATGLVLSAIFATLLALTGVAETFVEPLRVDPTRPAPVTLRLPHALVIADDGGHDVLRNVGRVLPRGESTADPVLANAVRAYESARRPPTSMELGAMWLLYFLLGSLFTTYLRSFSPSRGALFRTQAGILGLASVLLIAGKAWLLLTGFSELAIPVGALALWCAFYLDRRTALMLSVAMAFFAASLVGFRLVTVAVYLGASLAGTVTFRNRQQARAMIASGLAAALAASVVYAAARVVFEGGYDPVGDLSDPLRSELLAAATGGLASGVIAFFFQGVAVMALGAVSRGRLMDLTDLNQPLLQKMQKDAPGSWEHSRAMANLAEGAAVAIGADALLTRVGAYYHDLGKSVQPKYFVENQVGGETSPHDGLAPHVSADAIMAHVVEGTRILREGGIPEPVVEFAYTHHGTSVIEYFWHRCQEEGNPLELDKSAFRYPGMKPRTKETGILMLVDAIEAAARTVDPPSKDKFEALVQRVIFGKLHQGQLDETRLNMEDLNLISTNLVSTLCSAYHSRIKYPWQKEQEEREAAEAAAAEAEPQPGGAAETGGDVPAEREGLADAATEAGAASSDTLVDGDAPASQTRALTTQPDTTVAGTLASPVSAPTEEQAGDGKAAGVAILLQALVSEPESRPEPMAPGDATDESTP